MGTLALPLGRRRKQEETQDEGANYARFSFPTEGENFSESLTFTGASTCRTYLGQDKVQQTSPEGRVFAAKAHQLDPRVLEVFVGAVACY